MLHRTSAAAIALLALLTLAGCGGGGSGYGTASSPTRAPAADASPSASAFALTSEAFSNNATIPVKYSCSGESTSPPLVWSGAPAGTVAFVLVVHDPDAPLAGGFTHWIVFDLPGSRTSLPSALPSGVEIGATLVGGGSQPFAYRGMCPPVGASAHHYHFRLYALDAPLGAAAAGQSKDSIEAAMQGHILAQTDLVGLFGR